MQETTLPIFALALLLLVLAGSLMWVARDAKLRGRRSFRIVLLCFITWPLGFLIWRALRPPVNVGRKHAKSVLSGGVVINE
jgi:hypothetical protein